jgi:hypothetical protein
MVINHLHLGVANSFSVERSIFIACDACSALHEDATDFLDKYYETETWPTWINRKPPYQTDQNELVASSDSALEDLEYALSILRRKGFQQSVRDDGYGGSRLSVNLTTRSDGISSKEELDEDNHYEVSYQESLVVRQEKRPRRPTNRVIMVGKW